jgi:hypothetical protein
MGISSAVPLNISDDIGRRISISGVKLLYPLIDLYVNP